MAVKKVDKDGKSPKHGMDKKRSNKEVKRLKMYNSGKPVRNKKGKFVSQDLQSRDLPSTRIVPDRRWFGNTRVIGQKQLQSFREQMADKVDNPFMVLLREKKLPMQLLEDPDKRVSGASKRKEVLQAVSFAETFSGKRRQKRPKLSLESFDELVQHVGEGQAAYDGKHEDGQDAYALRGALEFGIAKERVLNKGQSKRIWAELYKVVDSSDVIIQILDARDPEGTRCRFLEQHLKRNHKHKHVIFLLNKVDLVPQWNVKRWLHHLSKEYPVLAFHASITNPFGKGALLSLLRQLARLRSDKKAISVGFVGYPNVGKSSVINTLRTKKVCVVAPIPGQTKVWQYITLMKRVFLIDCPGVVYNETHDSVVDTVLKGVVRIEKLEDATQYVPEVLKRVKPEYLMRAYKTKHWENAEDLLTQIAVMTGKLLKGGDADLNTAAKMMLLDWQRGRLPYFTHPPGYSTEAPTRDEMLPAPTTAPALAVTEEDAQGDAEGDPAKAAEAATALTSAALAAVAEQQQAAIPMRGGDYFMAGDVGPSRGAEAANVEDDDDVVSQDSDRFDGEDDEADGRDASGSREQGGAGTSGDDEDEGDEDDDEDDTGYGPGALSWEAVEALLKGAEGEQSGGSEDEGEPPDAPAASGSGKRGAKRRRSDDAHAARKESEGARAARAPLHPRDDHPKSKSKGAKRRSRGEDDASVPAAKKAKHSQHLSKRTLRAVKESQKGERAPAPGRGSGKAGRAAQLEMAAKRRGRKRPAE